LKKKFILLVYSNNFWNLAEMERWEDGVKKETIRVNKFFKVTEDWFFIYGALGGSGTGWIQGDIEQKIYIGDAEFEQVRIA